MEHGSQVRIALSFSPKALDELKAMQLCECRSKYDIPYELFPEGKVSEVLVTTSPEFTVCMPYGDHFLALSGVLSGNDFFCKSVLNADNISGEKAEILFEVKSGDETSGTISPKVRSRLDMWYRYIENLLGISKKKFFYYTYFGTVYDDDHILRLRVERDYAGENVKNLSAAIADSKNDPRYLLGKVTDFSRDLMTIEKSSLSNYKMLERSDHQIKIVIYDAASVITCRRMKTGLDMLCNSEAANPRLADFIFDPQKANRSGGGNISLTPETMLMKNMNPEQIRAVEGVMNAEDLYLIQGPPGTGKTTVIAEICYQNAVRGLKTLVVSQSNLAVDNAISRVMNHPEVRVLRKGDASRVEDEGMPFVEDNVVLTWLGKIAESAGNMSRSIDEKLMELKKAEDRLPDILELEDAVVKYSEKLRELESQIFFYKNVLNEAEGFRSEFFELVSMAYDADDIAKLSDVRNIYPPDFILPNNIYNEITDRYLDLKADVEKIQEYEDDLKFYSEYTEKIVAQLESVRKAVGRRRIEKSEHEVNYYYIDRELTEEICSGGDDILDIKPKGIKKLLFSFRWRRIAADYYRQAEKLMESIQSKTIRLCARIEAIITDKEYIRSVEAFHESLDKLCEDFDSQYYRFRNKYDKLREDFAQTETDYNFALAEYHAGADDKFYITALKNTDTENITAEEYERIAKGYFKSTKKRYMIWKELIAEWISRISAGSGAGYNSLKKLYLDNANVIGITCIQSGTRDFIQNYPVFDVVIIDESSKSTPPDIILPMLRGRKIVLVGDHKQLPPYIDSQAYDETDCGDNEEMRELMKVSLFEELYTKSAAESRTMLYRQYRMHRDIAGLVNQFYIDSDAGRIESPSDAPRDHSCQGNGIEKNNHVIWYDMPNDMRCYEEKSGNSFCNSAEVRAVKKLLKILNKNILDNGGTKKSVGVITFYDAQVKLLEEQLVYKNEFYRHIPNIELRIGSVDRFQGMEEDIIILSFVRNNKFHNIGFAKDSRRINVAMSRARELLMIVGCSENFTAAEDENASGMFKEVYRITSLLGGMRSASDIPAVPEAERDESIVYSKTFQGQSADDTVEDKYEDSMNILDYFILKAAYKFKGKRLTVGNISRVLGIAPVFVKSRIVFLSNEEYISCVKSEINILESGEKTIKFLSSSQN